MCGEKERENWMLFRTSPTLAPHHHHHHFRPALYDTMVVFGMYLASFCLLSLMFIKSISSFRYVSQRHASRVSTAVKMVTPVVTVAPTVPTLLKNFYTVSENEFAEMMKGWGQPAFRTKQVRNWVYEKGVIDFGEMLDLPIPLRSQLKQHYTVGDLHLASEQISKDGTIKRAYQLTDGQLIESVLMPYEDGRRTACISSQAGCAMGCVFCATGQMGFFRQLSSAEIFEQVQRFSAELRKDGQRLSNVVMMGK